MGQGIEVVIRLGNPPLITKGLIEDALAVAIERVPVEAGFDDAGCLSPVVSHWRQLVLTGQVFSADDDMNVYAWTQVLLIIFTVFVDGVEVEEVVVAFDPVFPEAGGITVHHFFHHLFESLDPFLAGGTNLGDFFLGRINY